jgi:hypothetical protein
MLSPAMKAMEPSRIALLMKLHKIKLTARKGKKTSRGLPKISPKTKPIAAI